MYTSLHTGAEAVRPYLQAVLEKKICVIDYERIKNDSDQLVVGSSKLAGFVGMYDTFRVLGEFLLLRKKIYSPFLLSGGSAYMHPNKESCEKALQQVQKLIVE